MPRDAGLEVLVREELSGVRELEERPMFGGLAWLYRGNLLCGVRVRGVMVRLGKGNDAWALQHKGISNMAMRGREMSGWINVPPELVANDELRGELFTAALRFVRTLPANV